MDENMEPAGNTARDARVVARGISSEQSMNKDLLELLRRERSKNNVLRQQNGELCAAAREAQSMAAGYALQASPLAY